jgi:hypothetical protein
MEEILLIIHTWRIFSWWHNGHFLIDCNWLLLERVYSAHIHWTRKLCTVHSANGSFTHGWLPASPHPTSSYVGGSLKPDAFVTVRVKPRMETKSSPEHDLHQDLDIWFSSWNPKWDSLSSADGRVYLLLRLLPEQYKPGGSIAQGPSFCAFKTLKQPNYLHLDPGPDRGPQDHEYR